MKNYKPKHLLLILPILLIFGGYVLLPEPRDTKESVSLERPHVIINNTVIAVEIADEAGEQWHGLSDRENLSLDSGMLFIFPNLQKRTFVMRRMHFPLDIIWISDDKIVGIAKNLPPEGENPTELYKSPEPVNYVLEVNGGFTGENNIRVGDEVKINLSF
ncbi:DUF192 domain-containing protein [Candidatus Parcubacteria bacterium]|nr:DUF192 domain-containing protein [Candidatus Parcubacteria bacterium]